jgi:hypothetical protein
MRDRYFQVESWLATPPDKDELSRSTQRQPLAVGKNAAGFRPASPRHTTTSSSRNTLPVAPADLRRDTITRMISERRVMALRSICETAKTGGANP